MSHVYLTPCNQSLTFISALTTILLYPGAGLSDDDSGPPAHFSEEAVDELLKPDQDDMDVDEEGEKGGDGASTANNDSFYSTTSSPSSNHQRNISAAYKAVRAAKLTALSTKSLSTGSSAPLTPLGSLLDTNDGRNFSAFQINSFTTMRNITASFDTASLRCKTCSLKPDHPVLLRNRAAAAAPPMEPVVFILSDQSFPACLPTGGEGHCLKILRLEDGSLADLTTILLDTISPFDVPAGSVILLHSLSHLSWVGPAAYAEDLVRARQRINGIYRSGLSILHGLPLLPDGSADCNTANDLRSVSNWYDLVSNPADRDIVASRATWRKIFLRNAGQSSTTASYPPCSGSQPTALPNPPSSKPTALHASDTSTPTALVASGPLLPSAKGPQSNTDPSSTPTALPNCSPTAQGSFLARLRLPASLDSLKPLSFQGSWSPHLLLSAATEPLERELVECLIAELNSKFGANLDTNFYTGRNDDLQDQSVLHLPEDAYIVVGSSHAFRLAAALNALGEHVTCLARPSWRLNAENVAATAKCLEEAVSLNPRATVIFQMMDSSIYYTSTEEGETVLPKRGEDGKFHVVGELVLADWTALKKIYATALPLLRAGGNNRKYILTPLPRYINSKCCSNSSHITNYGGKSYATTMGKQLAEIHGWIDDLSHGKRLLNYSTICPGTCIGLEDTASLKDKAGMQDLKARWGDDPVHLTPLGYTALAERLIETANSEAESTQVKEVLRKDTAKRREGISKSDWTASRWGPHNNNLRSTAQPYSTTSQASGNQRNPAPPPHSRPGKNQGGKTQQKEKTAAYIDKL